MSQFSCFCLGCCEPLPGPKTVKSQPSDTHLHANPYGKSISASPNHNGCVNKSAFVWADATTHTSCAVHRTPLRVADGLVNKLRLFSPGCSTVLKTWGIRKCLFKENWQYLKLMIKVELLSENPNFEKFASTRRCSPTPGKLCSKACGDINQQDFLICRTKHENFREVHSLGNQEFPSDDVQCYTVMPGWKICANTSTDQGIVR